MEPFEPTEPRESGASAARGDDLRTVRDYYAGGDEHDRLRTGAGRLELLRTQDVLRRLLPSSPVSILDVGGGTGAHARWLAGDGHRVRVVDPVPRHVELARRLPGVEAAAGDARALDADEGSWDVVLLLGPLYHLTDAADRARAWREAVRVVRPGGLVVAATISRFASLHDGLRTSLLDDDAFRGMVARDLAEGRHQPPPGSPWWWFTDVYLHHPDEPLEEARAAGLPAPERFAVEGSAGLLPEAEIDARLDDPERRRRLLWALREVEREPSLAGVSNHLLTVARRP
ncbi:class I SAM-dependent methyltransferase [Marinitenerispora sediminis]|uniref:Class I SAM-dependent methyltransferase n=1 Tax=Marinitenerispora sediminis TaxID=1931232 RepID=A0A368TAU2_9ACTN|nr:class I SAM-dependent methyltransferase [Marinitenerispora sediminis]RCV51219.1 class I SAM-dependent methyltransferase [Marinitenerispora sediminis]RCV57124.1 class I SAM-dependent methyltransferase [Marinitenerispora sediminis]RCV62147.1 class I SAM-dependent methyltransferase [Marinitenerispora sediminis]